MLQYVPHLPIIEENVFDTCPIEVREKIIEYYLALKDDDMEIKIDEVAFNCYRKRDGDQLHRRLRDIQLICKSIYVASQYYTRNTVHCPLLGAFQANHTTFTASLKRNSKTMPAFSESKALRTNVQYLRFEEDLVVGSARPENFFSRKFHANEIFSVVRNFRRLKMYTINIKMTKEHLFQHQKSVEKYLRELDERVRSDKEFWAKSDFGIKHRWTVPKLKALWNGGPFPKGFLKGVKTL